jgi:periodic tryptophan protein 2
MSFRLNDKALLQRVFESIPVSDVHLVVRDTPEVYLTRLMRLVVTQAESGPHLEFYLKWLETLMTSWARTLRQKKTDYAAEIRTVSRTAANVERELRKLAESNGYMLDYLYTQGNAATGTEAQTVDLNMLDTSSNGNHEDGEDEWIGLE